eukprot:gene4957-11160_t
MEEVAPPPPPAHFVSPRARAARGGLAHRVLLGERVVDLGTAARIAGALSRHTSGCSNGEDARTQWRTLPDSRPTSNAASAPHSNIGVDCSGAAAVAAALPGSAVGTLSLRHNRVGDEGAAAVARSLPGAAVARLNLAENEIGD